MTYELESWHAASGTQALQSFNDDLGLTLTYFTTRSYLVAYAVKWMNCYKVIYLLSHRSYIKFTAQYSTRDYHNGKKQNEILHDAQNGFHKNRSTVDHISSLTSIIETRKLKRKSTFAIFVDFKKAYDAIDRSKLFADLRQIGVAGKMYNALRSLYEDVKCCVKVNGFYTDCFSVRCGLKQGCCLSPIVFNLYINDMVNSITSLGIGVNIGDDIVSVLLYADDLVLLAE